MADFKLGNTAISDLKLGSLQVSKLYLGTTLIWPTGDVTPPTQVTGVTVNSFGSSTANISWNVSSDNIAVTGYWIGFNYDPEIGGNIIFNTTNLSIDATGLVPNTYYCVQVRAYDAAGNYSTMSTSVCFTTASATTTTTTTTTAPDTEAPSAPVANGTAITGANRLTVDWNASTDNVGVTGYAVYKSTDAVTYTLFNTTTSLSLAVTINAGQVTYFKVKAYDAAGNYSAYSNVVSGCNDNGYPCFF